MDILTFTTSDVFNYFLTIYVYISAPMFTAFGVMGLMRN